MLRPSRDIGFANYATYFSTPSLFQSIQNSLIIAAISTVITVALAFGFAYALTRSCMPLKGLFRRSEEHTSELQSLMRISYAVFCLKKKKDQPQHVEKIK